MIFDQPEPLPTRGEGEGVGVGECPRSWLMGMCCWIGSHFHDWIDYNGDPFSVELTDFWEDSYYIKSNNVQEPITWSEQLPRCICVTTLSRTSLFLEQFWREFLISFKFHKPVNKSYGPKNNL